MFIHCIKQSFHQAIYLKLVNDRALKTYISCQKRLLNQEVNNKQKAVKILQEKVSEVKNILNCKISYIDYGHSRLQHVFSF